MAFGRVEDAWTKCLQKGIFVEKYQANGKYVVWAFMDLGKAYDTIDRHGLWQILRLDGVRGKLLKAV